MSCEIQEPSSAVNDMVVVLTKSAELLFSDPVMDLIFPGAGYVDVVFSANERGGPLVSVTCSMPKAPGYLWAGPSRLVPALHYDFSPYDYELPRVPSTLNDAVSVSSGLPGFEAPGYLWAGPSRLTCRPKYTFTKASQNLRPLTLDTEAEAHVSLDASS